MRRFLLILPIFYLLLTFSCVPPKEEVLTEIHLNLQDSILQTIYSFQDKRETDSLLAYFSHPDPTYRYASAMALGSVRDKDALNSLASLLTDTIMDVRTAAAYAIGQVGEESGENLLIEGFDSTDTLGIYKQSNGAILEAIGRCGTEKSLSFLSTIKSYTPKDTALLDGQVYGIYQFATRGITLQEGTNKVVQLVTNSTNPLSTRVIASNYLYRAKNIVLDSLQTKELAAVLEKEEDPRIRMTTAIALGKTKSEVALKALTSQFAKEQDYRVKCNIMRAMGNFPYADMQARFFELIKNNNATVALTAASFFYTHGEARDARVYWRRAREIQNWPVQMRMYQAANKHMSPAYEEYKWLINNDLKVIIQDSTKNIYQRAEALRGLGEFAWNYKYLYDQALAFSQPVLKTAAVEALASIANHPDFDKNFGLSKRRVKKEMSLQFVDLLSQGDAGIKAIVAGVLAEENGFKELYKNGSFLHIAKRSLKLPKETETLYAIEKAIAYFEDKTYAPQKPAFNHPIDWSLLENVNNKSKAIINTSKGRFSIQLLALEAPGSVANFIKLAKSGFYDGKTVHRVVPNFVIQGGCSRGDGYGSLDYTIRSEVPFMHYDKGGYVGMASAGPDTEGTQWFITHSPTLHLDGNYTIFAKVVEGMNIIHQISIGDTIESIQLAL